MKKTDNGKTNRNLGIGIGLTMITLLFIVIGAILCNNIPAETMTKHEIISNLISAYSSLSLVLLVIQLTLSVKTASKHHDEKRREKTVDYMIKWSESLSWETSYAIKIVETFNHDQSTNLYKTLPFKVDYTTKEKLCPICSRYLKDTCNDCLNKKKPSKTADNDNQPNYTEAKNQEKMYTVDITQCAEIRWYIIKYLNHLESLLISWKEGIVDRDIIEEQFCYLYDPTSGKDTLQSFRNVAGDGKSYPTIEEFCLELRNKKQQTNNKFKELL